MKKIYIFFVICATILAASCTKEELGQNEDKKAEVKYVPMEFVSSVETKTILSEGETVNWLDDDFIAVIDNSEMAETHCNKFTVVSGGSSTAYFKGSVPEDATEFYALYPYKNTTVSDGVVSLSLPAIQTATLGSFADDLALMFAKADGSNVLNFKNVCSHIKFTLAEDLTNIKSITLIGNKAEILAGPCSVKWNSGDPTVTVSIDSDSETYVTLRNEDGTALTPGDYYFTVLPVNFEAGFTVILSDIDGNQIAKKTNAAYGQIKTRNNILEMKPLASKDYAPHLNYFVKYNDGFDLTFGDVTINNVKYPGGKLVSDNKNNSWNIASSSVPDGIYFIDPNCTKAQFLNAVAQSKKIIIGADASQRSGFKFGKAGRLSDGGEIFLMANLDCSVTSDGTSSIVGFDQHKEAKFETFGNIVLFNCHFKQAGSKSGFFNFNNKAIKSIDILIEDCEFGISYATYFMINGNSLEHTINLTFKNNIIYPTDAVTVTNFKLINNGTNTILDKFYFESNTIDNVIITDQNFLNVSDVLTSFSLAKNIFHEINKTETTVRLIKFNANTNALTIDGTITNNFYYNKTTGALVGPGIGKTVYTNWTINTPKSLNEDPIPTTWTPADGVFGAYKEVTYTENNTDKNFPTNVGAQRPDMTASATANEAGYQYPSVDLGTF